MPTRRQAKWVCTAACAATILTLVASIWCDVGLQFKRFGCGVGSGETGAWWSEYIDYGYDDESHLNFEVHPPMLTPSLPSLDR
jgi:hypothetical protein